MSVVEKQTRRILILLCDRDEIEARLIDEELCYDTWVTAHESRHQFTDRAKLHGAVDKFLLLAGWLEAMEEKKDG